MLTIFSSGLMYPFPKFGKCRAPPFDPLFEINSQLIVMFFTKSWNVIAPPYPAKLIVPLAVLFAYFANRIFVFNSKNKNILKEMVSFFGARVLTLVMEMVIM